MDCLKGESKVKKQEARFECGKCGAKVKKKDQVCKPVKFAEDKKKKTKQEKTEK